MATAGCLRLPIRAGRLMCVDAGIGGSVAYPATRYPTPVLPAIVWRVGVHVRDKTPLHGCPPVRHRGDLSLPPLLARQRTMRSASARSDIRSLARSRSNGRPEGPFSATTSAAPWGAHGIRHQQSADLPDSYLDWDTGKIWSARLQASGAVSPDSSAPAA